MKMKKHVFLLLAVVMAAALLSGCAGQRNTAGQSEKSGQNDRIAISMYLWDRSMFKEFTPWLEQKFPEIDFTFIQSYNTMDY